MMRGVVWMGVVMLLAACTRPNTAYEGGEGTATSGTTGEPTTADEADDRPSSTSAISGSASGSDAADEATTRGTEDTTGREPTSTTEPVTTGSTTDPGTGTGSDPLACCGFDACEDEGVLNCVCEEHGFDGCCNLGGWSSLCASVATHLCELECKAVPPIGPCDMPGEVPGCEDPCIMDCVCAQETYAGCCMELWTRECAAAPEIPVVLECINECPRG